MNQHLQNILNSIQEDKNLSEEEKNKIIRSLKDADKEFEITSFKLDRTEKVKRTTTILLEETIEELEQKRKAVEAQNRELEVESSLERVRTVALSMNMRDDMLLVCRMISEQLELLNVKEIRNIQTAIFYEEKGTYSNFEYYAFHDKSLVTEVEYDNHPMSAKFAGEMLAGQGKFFSHSLQGKELKDWYAFQQTTNQFIDTHLEVAPSLNYYWFSLGPVALGISTYVPLSETEIALFKRFRNVFELAYRRFLDIEKAAAQAREAQIQLALERARSQSMIMQHSNELDDTLRVFHEQVLLLNIPSAFSFLWLPDEKNDKHIFWAAWKEVENDSTVFKSKAINYPLNRNEPATAQCLVDWKGTEPIVSYHVPPSGVESYFAAWQELIDGVEQLKPEHFSGGLYYVEAFMKYGCFGVMVTNDLTEDEKKLLGRFAIEFERTYRRFLDLQKAEAQGREALIEASLERVRSKTMAMHNSQDVGDTVAGLFDEYGKLGIETFRCGIGIVHQEKRMEVWTAKRDANGKINFFTGYMDMTMHPMLQGCYSALKKKNDAYTYELEGNDLKEYFSRINSNPDYQLKYDIPSLPSRLIFSVFYFPEGFLFAFTKEELTAEATRIFIRFCGVFGQTYRRYLDLQKAEAQSREAKIEASLERVRSKAMSMQKSEDLAAAITIVFEELDKLDLGMLRCGIGILNKEKRTADVYSTTIADNDNVIQVSGDESMDIHPLLSGAFDAWLNQEDHSYTLKGEDLNNYYKAVAGENFKLPDSQSLVAGTEEMTQYYYNAVWSSGGLFAFRDNPFPEEAKTILRRFADVFTLTYTRFSDLKQAEAQAKEARIEVALERVRSRTLAMQKSDELAETAAVLFQQLIALGIEPNRLYISIVKNDQGDAEFWITDEDGSKVSTAFSANLNDNPTFIKMYTGWKQQLRSLVIDMHGEELEMYFRHLTSIGVPFKGGLTQKRRLQDIAYFSKGFIGMASPDEQPEETINLLERFAAVFNLTFTRFNDLKVAEAHAIQAEEDLVKLQTEKKRAEDALAELQVTQKQLIQSEKMASLGELTAGIAHEIQNPLNFVNNFSEVSIELIQEMVEEVDKGNSEEVKAIADDLVQNLGKINHHGKRADAIVKGMLQHSRSSTSTKEPTDINKLADEYFRLAYHGLRAKDKSFNATLKTNYDETIGNINIIPQDIGRVILNLITNAFYVVNEKTLSAVATPTAVKYEPTVSVSTKKINNKLEIKVSDNGNGIPQKILDKIFQPFFTTKPTGQGTGLGLSLSYDIVKAHGGELKVNTKENEGTEFIIQLPTT